MGSGGEAVVLRGSWGLLTPACQHSRVVCRSAWLLVDWLVSRMKRTSSTQTVCSELWAEGETRALNLKA